MDYFDENDAPKCGQCDVCKKLESMELTNFEFDTISKRIKELITEPCTLEKLLLKLKGDQEKMRHIVKWLIDNNKIVFRIDNKLEWVDS